MGPDIQKALLDIKNTLQQKQFGEARALLENVASRTAHNPALLSREQRAWVERQRWALAPLWWQPVQHGIVSLRRVSPNDEDFFRRVHQNTDFVTRFNRQRPWSGDLRRALLRYGQEPPALLGMLQWVVSRQDEPMGLISLSHIDLGNARAEFSIGFPGAMANGISHKACLLALHFSFFLAGLHRLYGYVYQDNEPALRAGERIGFRREGFLVDHFHFSAGGFVGVHVMGLTRQQAAQNPMLVATVRRRIGWDWGKPAPASEEVSPPS